MATLGFPSSPSTGTVYTLGTRTWVWTGQGWKIDAGTTALNTLTAVRVVVTTSTNSTSTNSGALQVTGGAGIGGDVNIGGSVTIGQPSTIAGFEIVTTATSTLQDVTNRGSTTTNAILVDNATISTSNNTGALVVTGGVGIGGDLHVGGEIVASKLTIEYTTITTTIVETDDIIKTFNNTNAETTDSGALTIVGGIGIGKDAYLGGVLYANNFNIYSTDTTSRIYGPVVIQNETSSTTVNNGALQIYGGVGIRGDLHVGNIFSNGDQVLTSKDGTPNFVSKIFAGEDISVSSATGEVTISDISTFQSVTNRGATTTNALHILNYSISTSSDTGAFRVSGGVGIGSDIYAGGSISGQSLNLRDWATITNRLTVGSITITSNEDATTTGTGALRIAGGMSIAGNIFSTANVYANGYLVNTGTFTGGTLSNKTRITNSETSISTDSGALQVVGGIGIGRDFYAGGVGNFDHIITRGTATSMMYGPLEISDVLFVNSYFNSYSSTSGSLIVGGGVGIGLDLTVGGNLYVASSITATNFYGTFNGFVSATGTITTSTFTNAILGGNSGELLYQSGTNQTGFITTSTPGNILVSNGVGAPKYQNTLTLSGTVPSNSTSTGTLVVVGGVGIGQDLYVGGTVSGNYLQISGFDQVSTVSGFLDVGLIKAIAPIDVFNASSTDTGALQVLGGVGIGGNVYIGQNLHVAGKAYLNEAEILTTQSGFSSILGVSIINQTLNLTTSTNSTSTDTGALIVVGGVGIGKDLYVGGDLTLKGALVITTASIGSSAVTSINAGTDTVVSSNIGNVTIWNKSTLQTVSDRGNSTTNVILVTNTTEALSTDTGALQVVGGLGVGGDAWIGGDVYTRGQRVLTTATVNQYASQTSITAGTDTAVSTSTGNIIIWNTSTLQSVSGRGNSTTNTILVTNETNATSTDSGALQVVGGVGIGGDVYVGGNLNVTGAIVGGALVVTTASISSQAATSITAGTDTAVSTSTGAITIWNTSTLQSITNRGNSTTNSIYITNGTLSTSTNSGALQVVGGVGVGGNLYVGKGANLGGALTLAPVIWSYLPTTFTNIPVTYGATHLTFTLEVDDTITNMSVAQGAGGYGPGSVNLVIPGTTFPGGTSPANDIVFEVQTFFSPGPVYSTDVTSTVSYVSGTLPPRYDSIKSTGNIGIGAENNHWTFGTDGVLTLPDGGLITSVSNGVNIYPSAGQAAVISNFSSNNQLYAWDNDVSIQTSPNNAGVTFNTWVFGNDGNLTNPGAVSVLSTANSTSTTTGALIVSGGVGVELDMYVGGDIFSKGSKVITAANTASLTAGSAGYSSTSGYALSFDTGTVVSVAISATTSTFATTSGYALNFNTGTLVSISIYSSSSTYAAEAGVANALGTGVYTITNTTAAISTNSGALQVYGGVGVGGSLYVGGALYQNGQQVLTTASVNQYANQTTIIAGTDTAVSTSTGAITIWNTSTLQTVSDRGNSTTNAILITNIAAAISTNSGALQVRGGVGIGGDLYVGGSLYQNGQQILTTASVNQYANQTTIIAGTDTAISTSTGNITIWNTSTLQTITSRGSTTTNAVRIANTTSSTSIVTGALTVAGGVGIAGALYVANTSYIGTGTILTSIDLQTVTHTATYITNDPGSVPGLTTIANTTTIYGTYDFGSVSDIWTFNDYNTGTNFGYYSIHDAATQPAFIVYIGFEGITDFNRIVLNINYTQSSGHTEQIDLYNYAQSSWDTFTTYSGSTGWFEFILGTINPAPYISGNKVTARIYHVNFGNTAHRTWIDYIALEKSIQGGQGPRGATGATGAQGIQGLTTTTTSTFIFSNTAASTATVTDNAVYIAGGLGIGKSLMVTGEVLFQNNVTFAGTTTFVLTTNTVYTDNILELHYPNTPGNIWAVNDGKDIGLRFHYYDTADRNGFLGRDNATGYLEWIKSGVEDTTSTISGDFGTFKTGSIILADTTASNSTDTGALIVAGGIGIGGQINAKSIVAGGVRSTTGSSAPANPTVGDIWYNTNNDRIYRYTDNSVVNFWLDYTGPVVQYPTIF